MCWECLLPISLGSVEIDPSSTYPDTDNPGSLLCICPPPPLPFRLGLSVGFWQPDMLMEVVRSPYCMVSLGGLKLPSPIDAPAAGQGDILVDNDFVRPSFYQVHILENFWVDWLISEIDGMAYEKTIVPDYLTELDPMWNDDELTLFMNPEAILFGNVLAQSACGADCIAATASLPLKYLFWCGGCNGSYYPLDGNNQHHKGGVSSSELLLERLVYKVSRLGMLWQSYANSPIDYCYQHLDPIIDKSQFRSQMIYPIPESDGTSVGGCCQPFGHTTTIWGSGKEFPYKGESFAYVVWRKRAVCLE